MLIVILGENYGAVVLRVHVSCQIGNENKMHHLIIKIMHDNDYYRTLMADTKIFEKEEMAYKELYPAFIQYQIDKGLEPITSLVPRFYHSIINDKEKIIVLEDLCPYGYRMADKRKGLDYDHAL